MASPSPAAYNSHMAMESLNRSSRPEVSSNNVNAGAAVGGSDGHQNGHHVNSQLQAHDKVGGNVTLAAVEGNGGIAFLGQGPGMDSFFTKINESGAFSNSLVDVAAGITAHQMGGEMELTKTDLNKPSPGVAAMAKLDNVKFAQAGMFAGGGGAEH
jgi:hypothetical protein